MKNKKFIGELISIKFSDRATQIYGVVLDYNNFFTLMKYNPTDFVLDGFIILCHKNIEGFERGEEERFTEKVLKAKGIYPDGKINIPITDLPIILSHISDTYGLLHIERKSEKICFIGKLDSLEKNVFYLTCIDEQGKWIKTRKMFRYSDIRVILFDTDYINSIKLVNGNNF